MALSRLLIIGLCCLVTGTAEAGTAEPILKNYLEEHQGTWSVKSVPYWTNGKLTGCQLTFNALQEDQLYRIGTFQKIIGSVGIMSVSGTPAVIVKVVVNELSTTNLGKLIPRAPTRAYLIGPDFKTNASALVSSTKSELPGGIFAIYQVDPSLNILMEAVKSKELMIGFNDGEGKSDTQLRIQLTVQTRTDDGKPVYSEQMAKDFAKCSIILFNEIESNLQK